MEQKYSYIGTEVHEKGKKFRAYFITWNNYTGESVDVCRRTLKDVEYGCFGLEVAPTTGTPHIQGYFRFKNPISWDKFRKKFLGASIFVARGDDFQNRVYCSKEGNFTEEGIPAKKQQGARQDLIELKDQIMKGEISCDDILIDNPMIYHQYGRTLEKIEDIAMRGRQRNFMTKGIWLYGPTGTGKTYTAYEMAEGKSTFVWKDDHGWWDGYKQEEVVIINEFRGSISYGEILDMLDQKVFKVRRRGREPLPFLSKTVIFTSSMRPEDVYHNIHENDGIDQLLRRLTITYMGEKYDELRQQDASVLSLRVCLEQETFVPAEQKCSEGNNKGPSEQMPAALEVAPAALECGAQAPPKKRGRGRPRKNF